MCIRDRFSPIMKAVSRFAEQGGFVLGICNGFQILLEAGLLPGAMQRNIGLSFICEPVNLKVEHKNSALTCQVPEGNDVIEIPIAHMEGNYTADAATLKSLNDNGQVLFRYCTEDGDVTVEANPNGSMGNIAGISNADGNVFGMMPHPERASEGILGGTDGAYLFQSLIATMEGKR